jgi:hypothetical protein
MRLRSYRRRRRGVASVLGILIMVGILITSILPTFIYVNEVNNYYDRTVVDLKITDNERSQENIEVYAYGHTQYEVDVFIINRAPLASNISRIWVLNNTLQDAWIFTSTNSTDLPLYLGAANQTTLRLNFTGISVEGCSYIIEITTDRGNKFSSDTNPLTLTLGGEWQTGTSEFKIQVLILSKQGSDDYRIDINGLDGHSDYVDVSGVQGQFFTIFDVPQAGDYNITVQDTKQSQQIGNVTTVTLTWLRPTAFTQFDDSEG